MNLESKIIIFKFMSATVIIDAVVVMHGSINANSIQSLKNKTMQLYDKVDRLQSR